MEGKRFSFLLVLILVAVFPATAAAGIPALPNLSSSNASLVTVDGGGSTITTGNSSADVIATSAPSLGSATLTASLAGESATRSVDVPDGGCV